MGSINDFARMKDVTIVDIDISYSYYEFFVSISLITRSKRMSIKRDLVIQFSKN